LEVELHRTGTRLLGVGEQRANGLDFLVSFAFGLDALLLDARALAIPRLHPFEIALSRRSFLVEGRLSLLAARDALVVCEPPRVLVGDQVRLLELVAQAHRSYVSLSDLGLVARRGHAALVQRHAQRALPLGAEALLHPAG